MIRVASLALVLGCGSLPPSTVAAGGGGATMLLRNLSRETVCYVFTPPVGRDTWGNDVLGPTEVVLPGAGRDWNLPTGRYDLRLQDCNRRDLMVRRDITITSEGVVVTFRERE